MTHVSYQIKVLPSKTLVWPLFAAVVLLLFVLAILPGRLFAADPIHLRNHPLNGQYIGKHIEFLSHQVVINSLINDLNLEDDFKAKLRSGNLVSDEKIKMNVTWTDTGYSAHFMRTDSTKKGQLFEIGVKDLLKPAIASKFTASHDQILNLLFHPRPYWLRFTVLNQGESPVDFLLELDKHLFEYINIYAPEQESYLLKRQAFTTPLSERDIKHKHFVFKLSAKTGETTYYLLANSWNKRNKDSVPLRIWSSDNFIRHASNDGLYSGIVVGLFLLVFFYNIFIFIFVRDPSYIFLSLVTLCQMLLEMSASGTGFKYLWSGHPLFAWQVLYQNTALVMGFNLLFYRSFINISRYTPILDKILLGMSGFFFICALSVFILPQQAFESMLWFLFIMDHLYSLPVLIPTMIALKNKNRSGLFALTGIFFYYVGLVKFGLAGNNILPYGLINYVPVKGLSFLLIMTLGLAHKFTLMKKSVIDLNINLEQRVIKRTEELKKANEKLKDLDTLKTRFFDNISHELRTPLTLITAPISSLLNGDYGKLPENSISVISSMKANTDRLLRMISDLLDFSKIEAGKMDVKFKNYNISQFLSFCVTSVDSAAQSKGILLSYRDNTDGLQAAINPDLMEKAVFNLLSNAIKFNQPQGTILVTLENDTDFFSIIIKDNGIGIPEDRLETIFDRFTQVDSSSTRRHEGTGIGLSFTREIVELHQGDIFVTSKPGKGSVFIVKIPILAAKDKADNTANINEPAKNKPTLYADDKYQQDFFMDDVKRVARIDRSIKDRMTETKTVLIVDDNDDMRDYLTGFLEKRYQIITAINGKDALKKLEHQDVDLVLSDLMMPEMDGYELIESIRSHEKYEGLPILLLTAKSHAPDKVQGFEKGANDYIIKPFDAEEVLARIISQLKFKSLRDKLIRANLNLKGKRKVLTEPSKAKIKVVKEFLEENFYEDILRDDLAKVAQMSPDHLGKMFKQYTGVKISDYVKQIRIKEASRQLKETNIKIIDIAFNVGFGSLRSFNQVFRDMVNDSPSNYRKKSKKGKK